MIEDTLKERGNNYGNFHTQANLTQTLERIFKQHYNVIHPNQPMPDFMCEAVHMIFHKLARIANGNPFYRDSWHDIGGYSKLVDDILGEMEEAAKKPAEALEGEVMDAADIV